MCKGIFAIQNEHFNIFETVLGEKGTFCSISKAPRNGWAKVMGEAAVQLGVHRREGVALLTFNEHMLTEDDHGVALFFLQS